MIFQDVESARQKYLEKRRRIWRRGFIILLIAALAALVIIITNYHSNFSYLLGAGVFIAFFGLTAIAIVAALATSKDSALYRKAYKAYFVQQTLAATFTDLRYNHAAGLDRALLRATGMISTGDVYRSNDLTMAKYKDVKFIQADAHIQTESTDSDGHTTYVTIFKGRFMIFEFPKKFDHRLELIGKHFGSSARIPGKNPTTGRKMSRISTESTDFNHAFKTYGEDGFEAYYLLDPAFIERVTAISTANNNKILLGFLDNTLLIGLNNGKDSFEPPSPRHPLDEKTELQKVLSDIKLITDFVDLLRLDKNRSHRA